MNHESGSPKMGTGSVAEGRCPGGRRCRRCLSPFSGVDPRAAWKRGTGTEPAASFGGSASAKTRSQSPFSSRRGLSTLEMVLALPILLFIMALMVNYGTVASWKVRALSVARHAVWGARWPRTGHTDPRPRYWPASAGVGTGGLGSVQEMDDSRVDQPVARGPTLPLGTRVNEDLLDPTLGMRQGSATLHRDYAMLGKMGPYTLEAQTRLLDNKWQYQRMGLSSNRQRRIPVIYELAKAPAGFANAYIQAVMTLISAPFQPQLQPLDNDDEFHFYGQLLGWGGAPDFHPRLRRFCTLDLDLAADRVEDLIDHIQGKVERDEDGDVTRRIPSVAETMAQAFINLYRRVIRYYEALAAANPAGPQYQAQIAALEAKIRILDQFLNTVRSLNGS